MVKLHHHYLLERMAQKGWSQEELQHAYGVFENVRAQRSSLFGNFEAVVHWVLFFVIVLGNVVIAAVIVPLLALFPNAALYGVIIILGACFGFLVEVVVRHIDHLLGAHHHFLIGVIIPFVAGLSFVLVVQYSQGHVPNLFGVERHPVAIGVIYASAFILPYLITKGLEWLHMRYRS